MKRLTICLLALLTLSACGETRPNASTLYRVGCAGARGFCRGVDALCPAATPTSGGSADAR